MSDRNGSGRTGDAIVRLRIHPAIGIARVGNSTRPDGWFLGPETPNPPVSPTGSFKDPDGAIKRQAARFRLYGYTADGRVVREVTTSDPGTRITWGVHVANRKAGWYEFHLPLDIPDSRDPAAKPSVRRNPRVGDRGSLVIDPGRKTLDAASGAVVPFTGGRFLGRVDVPLGEMHADEAGRLVVLGGHGTSGSPDHTPLASVTNNDGWYDDISDGPVTATVTVDGMPIPVDPAWVVVAPPNFAPEVRTLRTLYDLLFDVFVSTGQLPFPATVSFGEHIEPILRRFCELQWVNAGFAAQFGWAGPRHFLDPDNLARLGSPAAEYREVRRQVYTALRDYGRDDKSPMPWPWMYGDGMASVPRTVRQYMTLSPTQDRMLLAWSRGEFDPAPFPGHPSRVEDAPPAARPGLLDRAALDFCVADAFHPGIEVTWPIRHASMFAEPFRILPRAEGAPDPDYGDTLTPDEALAADGPLHAQGPGDLSRWMAVPWQTDTAGCRAGYESQAGLGPRYDPYVPTFWPARVPNHVLKQSDYETVNRPDGDGSADREAAFAHRAVWLRGLTGSTPQEQRRQMVDGWYKLGIVETRPYTVGDGRFPQVMQVESTPEPPFDQAADTNNLVNVHVPARMEVETATAAVVEATGHDSAEVTVGYVDNIDPYLDTP
ncbi:LodA/GoxA family CTQ-dependent oxidase [Embleya scabrispora]|uniref:LodA/GoxA family CTQ-dependent oxidase n=1 Tax=Embleya scabrispora TaxID=159449 RepID=UPI001F461CC7|nr:LodA/GoxA family CTQ-dependent oxidase [Embleya scabrispora]